MVMIT